jgi:hypothetical protein
MMNRPITANIKSELTRLAKRYSKYGFDYDAMVEMYNLPSELDDEAQVITMRLTLAEALCEEEYFSYEDLSKLYGVPVEYVEEITRERETELMENGGLVEVSFTPPKE